MPKATANLEELHHHDLKSLPEGFIDARRLTYGEKLERRAMVSGMKIESSAKSKDFAGEMQLVNEQATIYDFRKCIVDHNLEKEVANDVEGGNGLVKMDLSKIEDIKQLDPRVGEEIDNFLSELNNFEEDEGN